MTQKNPVDLVLERLHAKDCKPKGGSGKYSAICPAHADTNASLSIGVGHDGQVLLYCFAGCELHAIITALDLTAQVLSPVSANQNGTTIAATERFYSIKDAKGNEVARHYRRDHADGTKEMWWGGANGARGLGGRKVGSLPLFGTELLKEFPDATVIVTEGEKDAMALRDRRILALGTVTGAGGTTAKCPSLDVLSVLKGRNVVLWPDDDDVGRQHMILVARGLRGIAASVHTINWKGPEPKCGAADFNGSDEELNALLGLAVESPIHVSPAGGTISVTTDITGTTDQALAALLIARPDDIYQRAGKLVAVRGAEPTAPPSIIEIQPARLRELLASSADWIILNEHGSRPSLPPVWAVDTVFARTSWPGVRPIAAVSEIPVLRPDGSITQELGYDGTTQTVYLPAIEFPAVPEKPSTDQVVAAVESLKEPLCDFPFTDDSARASAIAAILSIIARHAIEGPVPLFHFGAPVRGSGKTLLATACALAATGRNPMTFTSASDEDERRKEVMSIGLSGANAILIDNIEGTFSSPTMAMVLTNPQGFSGRLLGLNQTVTVPLRCVWFASGNNVQWAGDLGRRVVPVIQDPKCESPEDRSGFRYPRLLSSIKEMHPRLVSAALTILRAHAVAGRPQLMESRFGSFESWDEVVRSAIMWATGLDCCAGRATLAEAADGDVQDLATVLVAWRDAWAIVGGAATVAQSVHRAIDTMRRIKAGDHTIDADRALVDALRTICPTGDLDGTRIGKWLAGRAGRIVRGLRFERLGGRNVTGWRVVEA